VGVLVRSRRHAAGLVCIGMVAVALTACGSSSSSSTGAAASGATSSSSASTATGAASSSASSTATGTPYVVGMINDDPTQPEPDQYATVEAAAKQINAAGGVNGHPIQVIHCSGQLNPNATAACARQFVANSSMLATVGNFEANGAGATEILDAGGLAQLGNFATAPADFSCHSCFPFGLDSITDMASVTALTDVDHVTKIGQVWIDVPAARAFPPLIAGVVKASGRKVTFNTPIYVPPATTDLASVVAEIGSSGANGILPGLPEVQDEAFYRALISAGNTTPIGIALSSSYPPQLAQLPSSFTNHIVMNSLFRRTGPVYEGFVKAQDADGYPLLKETDEAFNAYLGLQMFVSLVKGMSHPTRTAIIAAGNKLTAYNTGVTQPINFQAKSKILGGAFGRLTNTQEYYYKLGSGGTLVAVNNGQAYDVTKAP
jgi:ABC-type branched-subunit amino acid transport system substrate-binding protein